MLVTLAGGIGSLVATTDSDGLTSAAFKYSLVLITTKSLSKNGNVSLPKKTSSCSAMHPCSSTCGLSFFRSARTYLAKAVGSASHLRDKEYCTNYCKRSKKNTYNGSKTGVSQFLSASWFSTSILSNDCYCNLQLVYKNRSTTEIKPHSETKILSKNSKQSLRPSQSWSLLRV